MAGERAQASNRDGQQSVYEVRVRGCLAGHHWRQWFDCLSMVTDEQGETVLRVAVADQAALYGLLARLRDLALPLVSVHPVDSAAPGATEEVRQQLPRQSAPVSAGEGSGSTLDPGGR